MVDNLLHEHVALPHVLDLAVHLVQLTTWMGRGGHTETFSLLELFPWGSPSWLKVVGGGGGVGWVAHVIIVSPPVPIGLGFFTFLGLGLRLVLGGQDLGLGLDN